MKLFGYVIIEQKKLDELKTSFEKQVIESLCEINTLRAQLNQIKVESNTLQEELNQIKSKQPIESKKEEFDKLLFELTKLVNQFDKSKDNNR